MFVIRDKNGEIVAYASRREDAEGMASTRLDGEEYIVEESFDRIEITEIIRSYKNSKYALK